MPARPALLLEDVLPALGSFPSNLVAEILGGEVVDSPRPRVLQTLAASAILGSLLGPYVRGLGGPGGWLLLFAPELHLVGGEMVVPDLAGWRRERLPEAPDVTVMTLAPDWVCEVLSPKTMALDRGHKMLAYAHAGVEHVWLVDPDLRTLEVYRFEDDAWTLLGVHEEAQRVRAEPFEGMELELSLLWQR
jgi:Uma2 family endonuclease